MKSCFKASNPTAQSTVMESAAPQFAGGPKLLEQIRDSPMVGSGESDGLKSSAQAEAANPTRPAKKTNPGFSITNEFMVAPSLPGCPHPAMQNQLCFASKPPDLLRKPFSAKSRRAPVGWRHRRSGFGAAFPF